MLTGPRTVGTSTTGWEVFTRSQPKNPTAFIDLAQIGFISAGPDLSSRDHDLRAANLAAMVEVYRKRGCRRIIAVGAVLDATERDLYVAALAPMPLSIFRFTATPDQLRQRATARTAPTGGPHLAGDDLRGRSDQAINKVLDQALWEADQLEISDGADHVIGTEYLSPGQAAESIINLLFVATETRSP